VGIVLRDVFRYGKYWAVLYFGAGYDKNSPYCETYVYFRHVGGKAGNPAGFASVFKKGMEIIGGIIKCTL
jgi:hypothetical protein